MQYRPFGKKIDFRPSALGFGLMRLPMSDPEKGIVDLEEAVRIVRHSINQGVNYLDTAYPYHKGESEVILSEILKDGYREKVKIASKFPLWILKTEEDLDRIFFEQMEKMKVSKIDFYLLHALNRQRFTLVKKFNMIDWLEKKKAYGYIDHFGFSFHDNLRTFKNIVDYYDWDFCQIQYNIMDTKEQAGSAGLKYAHKKGLGVIVMEPLRGGQLTASIPTDISDLWHQMSLLYGQNELNPVQYLLDWIWNQEEVSFILSGMSNFQQTQQNLIYANESKINHWSKAQTKLIDQVKKAYLSRTLINCTSCNYCKVCPQKIAIPYIFGLVNQIKRFENDLSPRWGYSFLEDKNRAKSCTNCRLCVEHCPQMLNIPDLLKKSSAVFDNNQKIEQHF